MSNDLTSGTYVIIFLVLISILSSFFVIFAGNVYLSEDQNPEVPFNPQLHGSDVNATDSGDTDESFDWWRVIGGIALLLAGAATFVFPIVSHPFLIGGASLLAGSLVLGSGLPGGSEWISGLPIIGDILGGLNYVATAITSFFGLMSVDLPVIGSYPILLFIIGVPILFFFFVFIIRFIRGQ